MPLRWRLSGHCFLRGDLQLGVHPAPLKTGRLNNTFLTNTCHKVMCFQIKKSSRSSYITRSADMFFSLCLHLVSSLNMKKKHPTHQCVFYLWKKKAKNICVFQRLICVFDSCFYFLESFCFARCPSLFCSRSFLCPSLSIHFLA